MNKKGQLGKIITSFPVMLLIFFLIGIYLVIVGFTLSGRPPSFPPAVGLENPILLKAVTVGGNETTLLEAFVRAKEMEVKGDSNLADYVKEIDKTIKYIAGEDSYSSKQSICALFYNQFLVTSYGAAGSHIAKKFDSGSQDTSSTLVNLLEGNKNYQNVALSFIFSLNAEGERVRAARISIEDNYDSKTEGSIRFYYGKCLEEAKK